MEHPSNDTMFTELSAWEKMRLGKFTASEIHKLMVKGRGKDQYFGQGAMTYIKSKVAEIITGERTPDVSSNAIEYGRSMEPEAFEVFNQLRPEAGAIHFGISVPEFYPYGDFAGGSPDGFADPDAIIEIKCPYNSTNHIDHLLLTDETDLLVTCQEYYYQVQANMLFTGKSKAYFISYDPRVIQFEQRIKILELSADADVQIEINERIGKAAELMSDYLTKIGIIK
jgi:hypothetical protein